MEPDDSLCLEEERQHHHHHHHHQPELRTSRPRRVLEAQRRPGSGRLNGRPSAVYGFSDVLQASVRWSQNEQSHSSAPLPPPSSYSTPALTQSYGQFEAALRACSQEHISHADYNTPLHDSTQHGTRVIVGSQREGQTGPGGHTEQPQSPPEMPASSSSRQEVPLRNVSMESGVSSASSTTSNTTPTASNTTPTNPARDADPAPPTPNRDASTYIAGIGDPIQAVEKLLKDNSRLWNMVEAQRARMLIMQDEFIKVCSQRDRYLNRLKDYKTAERNAVPAVPLLPEAVVENGLKTPNTNEGNAAIAEPGNSGKASSKVSGALGGPRHSREAVMEASSAPAESPSKQQTPIVNNLASNADRHHVSSLASSTRKAATSTQPLSSPSEKSRKAAPAPLNLSQASSPAYQTTPTQTSRNSESDYGEGSNDDRTPELDRGRRRTRQEDDRDREAQALAEEARSRSAKSSKSSKGKGQVKAWGASEEEHATSPKSPKSPKLRETPAARDEAPLKTSAIGLPSSPRAALNGAGPTVGSIASALAPGPAYPPAQPEPQFSSLPPKSPGLPMSPRPGDRPVNAPLPRIPAKEFQAPGPLSPRQGLPHSPRAPKYPIPIPASASVPNFPTSTRGAQESTSMAERLRSSLEKTPATPSPLIPSAIVSNSDQEIFTGFAPPDYPDLLISPRSLSSVTTKVFSSRLRPSRNSTGMQKDNEADLIFTLTVTSNSDSRHLWWLEKRPSALTSLDHLLRSNMNLTAAVPNRDLFSGHSPAKLDARRASINQYFESMFSSPMSDKAAMHVCKFLSTDVIAPDPDQRPMSPDKVDRGPSSPRLRPRKEGILSKKGAHFGGWKERYFILEEGQLKHLDPPKGTLLGNIRLQNAAISRASGDADEDAEYRHAFTIHEPKRRDANSHIRHILCAESDEERDSWVDALLQHVGGEQPLMSPPLSPVAARTPSFNTQRPSDIVPQPKRSQGSLDSVTTSSLQSLPYSETIAADAPKIRTPTTGNSLTSSSMGGYPPSTGSPAHPTISGPVSGGPIQNSHAWGNKAPSPTRQRDKEMKKRSVFGFMRSSDDPGTPSSARIGRGVSPRPPIVNPNERRHARGIFGVPLAEAAEVSQPAGIDMCLPSPVYRCIEFLEAKQAWKDEGLFRVSGSSVMIQSLKDRFDAEGDVNLLDGKMLDVNAVASLLKRYLRELPESMLTNKLHSSFLQLLDIEDKRQKLAAMNLLVHKLPEANFDLLVAIFQLLIKVASHTETNKMSIKNINIVFSPTINIPSPLITLFITEYDSIFTPSVVDEATASPILDSLASFQASSGHSIDTPGNISTAHSDAPLSAPLHSSFASSFANTPLAAAHQSRTNTSTPPPRDQQQSAGPVPASASLVPPAAHSSASSSPSSFVSGGAGTTQGRKGVGRENSLLGGYGGSGGGAAGLGLGIGGGGAKGLELPTGPPGEGTKRKSSYTRLREGIQGRSSGGGGGRE